MDKELGLWIVLLISNNRTEDSRIKVNNRAIQEHLNKIHQIKARM